MVFARRVATSEYLARLQLADLFLDTLPYNAGTTASDALWAGLPVLTSPATKADFPHSEACFDEAECCPAALV